MAAEEMGDPYDAVHDVPYAAVHDVPYVAVQDVPYAICFTDPASLGDVIGPDGRPCFTSTGDVDDIPSIILLAQTYRDKITFYICDDRDGKRYHCFMGYIGRQLEEKYGCKFEPEIKFRMGYVPRGTRVHIHAPVSKETVTHLSGQSENIGHVFTQGDDDQCVNIKGSEGLWETLRDKFKGKTTMFSTNGTSFRMPKDDAYLDTLNHPTLKKVWNNLFIFEFRKKFGLPLHVPPLPPRLYGPTSFNGGPGNGIAWALPVIKKLRDTKVMPEQGSDTEAQLGVLPDIVRRMRPKDDPVIITNIIDLLWLLNNFCGDYASLLVEVERKDGVPTMNIPNMGNLGEVTKSPRCDPEIAEAMEKIGSTPLFDFTAAWCAIYRIPPIKDLSKDPETTDILRRELKKSLTEFNNILSQPKAKQFTKGGGGKKSRLKKSKNSKKLKKSKKLKSRR